MPSKLVIILLTYGSAVEQHLLQVASIVVESEVPGAGIHVLNEACFLEAAQQKPFGSFGSWDRISQGPGQRLAIQQFHKVKLNRNTETQSDNGNTIQLEWVRQNFWQKKKKKKMV